MRGDKTPMNSNFPATYCPICPTVPKMSEARGGAALHRGGRQKCLTHGGG